MSLTCKCGVAWDSMLYGSTCAKCGENSPLNAQEHVTPWAMQDYLNLRTRRMSKEDIVILNTCSMPTVTPREPVLENIIADMKAVAAEMEAMENEHEEILKGVAKIVIERGMKTITNIEAQMLYDQVKEARNSTIKVYMPVCVESHFPTTYHQGAFSVNKQIALIKVIPNAL